ncbi:hypothetical protein ACFE04_016637 [Oxalis oulophora]
MDPPLPPTAAIPFAVDSSDDSTTTKLRLMCSYGGHIMPRPHDKSLCYVGGDTRMVVVDRSVTLTSLCLKLGNCLMNGKAFNLKYQLPNEDLDSLISVTTDEDLDNMIEEYDRNGNGNGVSQKQSSSRLRLFLFPVKIESSQSMIGPILESSVKSEEWFLSALNNGGGATGAVLNRGFSDSASVNCLLGLDDDVRGTNTNVNAAELGVTATTKEREGDLALAQSQTQSLQQKNSSSSSNVKVVGVGSNQEIQSVPDSPMLENNSSYGSTSSSPSLANLPAIRGDEGGNNNNNNRMMMMGQPELKMVGPPGAGIGAGAGGGLEEQFAAHMNLIGGVGQKQLPPQQQKEGDHFMMMSNNSAPPPLPMTIAVPGVPISAGGYTDRMVSDDERSDHGVPAGYRKQTAPVQAPPQPQPQQKSSGGGSSAGGNGDLPSPDSVTSDSSLSNPLSRQKPMIYQDPSGVNRVAANNLVEQKANIPDPNTRVQLQQPIQDSGYILQGQAQPQFDRQQAPQQQQYIQAGGHYILHQPTGPGQIPSYYPVYPPQQQQQQQQQQYQPFYYMPAMQQQQAYNVPVQQQSGITEPAGNRVQAPPNPNILPSAATYSNPLRNTPITKPEMAPQGMYRAGPGGNPQLVQLPPNHQQQYMGYSQQVHHPSQSVVPPAAGPGNYGYEFADPSHGQMYYTQPMAQTMSSQYQTMTTAGTGAMHTDGSSQFSDNSTKQQHI